jgi:hypothetical protein
MANIKISELNPLLTVQDADVIPIVDNAITKKVTAEILRSYTQGNSVLLTGNQTIAGIKTFTSQLASSVATGTAPFSVASTTKVTNLNADLLDGLSSADFQATLSGTGIVKSTAGTISYLTDNSGNWNTAFNDSIVSAAVTGTTTKTLTLNQQDGGSVTASWTDDNTDAVSSVFGRTGAVVATEGDYSLTQLSDVTLTSPANGQVLKYNGTAWINGTDLNSGTVTSVGMSVPTGLSVAGSPITTSGTLALSMAAGYSLPTDASQSTWNTAYNERISSASAPLAISSNALSISQATASVNGYLSSTDWTTFNNKQTAGNYITALTGEASASGPGSSSITLTNSAVIGKVLTGLNVTGGSVSATDSILDAFGKVQNQINSLVGGTIYKGTWDASTNTPTLTSSVGTQGYYYIVSVAGSTNLNGITSWNVGDWAIFDGTAWQKVDNTDSVVSVNGLVGAVSLTTSNITEGTNLYYTEARVDANSNVAANTAARHNAVTLGTANGLSLSTQALSLALASGSTTGALSSTDWTTFNNKQNALTNPITGTGTTNYLPKFTGASALGNSLVYDSGTAIGIGTATPTSKLNVIGDIHIGDYGTDAARVLDLRTNNSLFTITTDGTAGGLGTTISYSWANGGQGPLKFNNAAGEVMRLSAGGNCLIGTTTDSGYKLVVNGDTLINNKIISLSNTDTSGNSGFVSKFTSVNANSRSWKMTSDVDDYGDFVLGISTTQSGNTYSNVLRIDRDKAATFSSSVTATQATLKANNVFNQDGDGQITIRGASVPEKVLLIGFDTTSNYSYLQSIWQGNSAKPLVLQPFSGNVLISTNTDIASSKLTIESTTQGVLVPRMTTTQINAIGSPANGLIAYNTTLAVLCFYDGSGWRKVSHSSM